MMSAHRFQRGRAAGCGHRVVRLRRATACHAAGCRRRDSRNTGRRGGGNNRRQRRQRATVAADVAPAIACDGQPTPAQTEGPYRPTRRSASLIEEGVVGDAITLTGYVLDTECRPIAGAVVDFWQADGAGVYDNEGYRLLAYTLTDDAGRYVMETVVPVSIPAARHIHVKGAAARRRSARRRRCNFLTGAACATASSTRR